MQILTDIISFTLHIDSHLADIIQNYGFWAYAIIFVIIFCETGLVFTPFLPGDSLLFAAGAFASRGSLNIATLFLVLALAAILGDTVNYWIGYKLGHRLLKNEHSRFLKKSYIEKTQAFYAKHGGKTIMLARFVPIVRTFAPFIAGVGKMDYKWFLQFNIIGGLVWVGLFTFTGYFFGNLPFFKDHFELIVLIIIGMSLVPPIVEAAKHLMQKRNDKRKAPHSEE